jgi:Uma2 family endonuclease
MSAARQRQERIMVTRTVVLGPAFDHLEDDTEETLVGSTHHQDAIVDAYISLKRHRRRRGLPWFVGNQTKLVIPRAGGQPPYQPSPDLMIHTTAGPEGRASLPISNYGPPALVIEVVSPATALRNDLNFGPPGGKPPAYAEIGVNEYLTFDPFGDYIPEQIRAWRLGPEHIYVPWEQDESRRWASDLGIAFAPQGWLLRVFDEDGHLIPNYEDLEGTVDTLQETVGSLEATVERQAREKAEDARRIAELQEALRRARGEG